MVRPEFLDVQYRFTAHMRDPERCPGPADVEDRRLNVYRDLIYRNVEGFIANGFPVLRRLTDDDRWHDMVRDYFIRHRARSALFSRVPQEFLLYLCDERDDPLDPPFIRELAHYEWLEVEVSLDTRELNEVTVDPKVELLDGCPVPNPVMRPYVYAYPVHQIGPALQPFTVPEEPTYLVVFRNRSDKISFLELNTVSARLLELILEGKGRTGRHLLTTIATELKHPNDSVVIEGGHTILQTFLEKDIVLGTQIL